MEFEAVSDFFQELQETICRGLEEVDGTARFGRDSWRFDPGPGRPGEGGGLTRVLQEGPVFEKAAVNHAQVTGTLTEDQARHLGTPVQPFQATGISLIIHPRSPLVPTVHMNLRSIRLLVQADEPAPAAGGKDQLFQAGFGGGTDLTPHYLFREDAGHFHRTWREVCDRHDPGYYRRFKKWCDEYFFLPHRGEARGIGGIFFEGIQGDPDRDFRFIQDVGSNFLPSYLPIVQRRKDEPWGDRERAWQLLRRGRYVEFNLLYDRGTHFGLKTGGRTESILVSMPPRVEWSYDPPPPGPREKELLEVLKNPVEWV